MTVHSKPSLSPEQYLAIERSAESRSEYLEGEVIGMTGASRRHSLITLNVGGELSRQLEDRPCEVHVNDLRLLVAASHLYTYPDVIVVCGDPKLTDQYQDTLTNPTVLIEVLSPSIEAYDRGTKFGYYRTLESLREYLLVAQDLPQVEQYIRQSTGQWLYSATSDLAASVVLPSIECQLPLERIYKKVRFGEKES